jgi:hypothetical protein
LLFRRCFVAGGAAIVEEFGEPGGGAPTADETRNSVGLGDWLAAESLN